jgi:hypothetical protein
MQEPALEGAARRREGVQRLDVEKLERGQRRRIAGNMDPARERRARAEIALRSVDGE